MRKRIFFFFYKICINAQIHTCAKNLRTLPSGYIQYIFKDCNQIPVVDFVLQELVI